MGLLAGIGDKRNQARGVSVGLCCPIGEFVVTYEEMYPKIEVVNQPEYKWKVMPFGKDGLTNLTVQLGRRPCLWNRIWMRLFFGWRFEAIEEDSLDG